MPLKTYKMTVLCQFVSNWSKNVQKLKKVYFLTVFGLYPLKTLAKNLQIKKIENNFETNFQ